MRSVLAYAAPAVLAIALSAVAQNATTADELLAHAKNVYSSAGSSAALPEYEKALAAYRALQNRHGEAITLGLIGNCYKHLGDRTRALARLDDRHARRAHAPRRDRRHRHNGAPSTSLRRPQMKG